MVYDTTTSSGVSMSTVCDESLGHAASAVMSAQSEDPTTGECRLKRRSAATSSVATEWLVSRSEPPFADLLAPHRVVEALELEQLVVAADFDDAAALEHVNAVGVHDGRQPVRDEDRDDIGRRRDVAHRAADLFFGERVERRRRFVEHQEMRPAEQRARDREALLLAAGDLHAAFADHRVESLVGAVRAELSARGLAAARRGTRRRSRPGRTNSRFSRIEPEKSCASCVTRPMRSRNRSRSTRSLSTPL